MKVVKAWACVAAMAVGGFGAWQAVAQETPAKGGTPAAKVEVPGEPVAKKTARGPLPAQYGKLGLSDEIKDELYQIDDDYDAKIAVLTAEIKELQVERESKMQEKLTEAQRTQLKELRDAAAAKRAAAKTKTEKKPAVESEKAPEAETKPAVKKP